MTLLSPADLTRCLLARDLPALQAHLREGGDPNAKARRLGAPHPWAWGDGDTLVHATIYLAWPEGLDALIRAGGDPEGLSLGALEVRTPLGRALQTHGVWEQPAMRHPLLSPGTPMSWAATGKARLACLQRLLDAGASAFRPVDGTPGPATDGRSRSGAAAPAVDVEHDPLHLACAHRLFDAWVLLQRAGRIPDAPGMIKTTVLETRTRWVEHWLRAGVSPGTVLDTGDAALHLACSSRHKDAPGLVAALLVAADPNQATAQGDRPLHLALLNDRHGAAMIPLLLDAGADPTLPDARGVSMAQRCEDLLTGDPTHPVARVLEHHSLTRLAESSAGWGEDAPRWARRRF